MWLTTFKINEFSRNGPRFSVDHSSPASYRLAATAEVGEYHYDEVSDEPDIIRPKVLVNVDQDQNSWHKDAKKEIGPLRNGIGRIEIRKQEEVNKKNDSREKQRENEKVNVHTASSIGVSPDGFSGSLQTNQILARLK